MWKGKYYENTPGLSWNTRRVLRKTRGENSANAELTIARMSRQAIDQPNLRLLPSRLPDQVLELTVRPNANPLSQEVVEGLRAFQHTSCYFAAGKGETDSKVGTLQPLISRSPNCS